MVEVSIVMAAHNEGDLLWRTVSWCREVCGGLDYEIVVADDASDDDCISQLNRRFPEVAVHRFDQRRGTSPAKDFGAQHTIGEVLVFLDAHCKPEGDAISLLAKDVRELDGEAVVTPTIAWLDPETWTNNCSTPGHGYLVDLEALTNRWIPIDMMRPSGRFFESPTLMGCCVALSKPLYEKLWGFDRNMYMWGVEDVDLGVKSWMLGHPVLHDVAPIIGHRFQKAFNKYSVPPANIVANRLRMAYKILPPMLWSEWLGQFRRRFDTELWSRAWDVFTLHRGTAEVERVYLHQNRKIDIVSYACRFGLPWPLVQIVQDAN